MATMSSSTTGTRTTFTSGKSRNSYSKRNYWETPLIEREYQPEKLIANGVVQNFHLQPPSKNKNTRMGTQRRKQRRQLNGAFLIRVAIFSLFLMASILLFSFSTIMDQYVPEMTYTGRLSSINNDVAKYERLGPRGRPNSRGFRTRPIPYPNQEERNAKIRLQARLKQPFKMPIPGLRVPHYRTFTKAPDNARKVACWQDKNRHMARAFESRNWKLIETHGGVRKESLALLKPGVEKGLCQIMWTRGYFDIATSPMAKPWQRYSWLHTQHAIDNKSSFHKHLSEYEEWSGESIDFVPKTYVLPKDKNKLIREQFSNILLPDNENGRNNIVNGVNNVTKAEPVSDGTKRTWVLKLPASNRGTGIAILGANSPDLHLLREILDSSTRPSMPEFSPQVFSGRIRNEIILHQKEGDVRNPKEIANMRRNNDKNKNPTILVQEYVCNELPYQGHKFHVRVYFLIASVDPLLVMYHDGFLRVAHGEYKENDLSVLAEQVTNLDQENKTAAMATFEEWQEDMKSYLAQNDEVRSVFPQQIVDDPIQHVRNQMKAAIAKTIDATRHVAYRGYRSNEQFAMPKDPRVPLENSFALLGGDFIVDKFLNVHMTEAQSSPALYDDHLPVRRASNDKMLPKQVDILEHIYQKQVAGEPILPMDSETMGGYEIVYTDDYRFKYDVPRYNSGGAPC